MGHYLNIPLFQICRFKMCNLLVVYPILLVINGSIDFLTPYFRNVLVFYP
jgi:hypothetical protein